MTWENQTPLDGLVRACEYYDLESVQKHMTECLAQGVDISDTSEEMNYRKKTPLSGLCYRRDFTEKMEIAEYLLVNGVDVNRPEDLGWTPLHCAVMTESVALVELLLAHGADPMGNSHNSEPAMYYAINEVKRFNPNMVLALVNGGFDLSFRSKRGYTALHEACHHHNVRAAQLMLDLGLDINAQERRGYTPLTMVVVQRFSYDHELVTLLLQRGADPCIKDNNGWSALEAHLREAELKPAVVKLLLSYDDTLVEANQSEDPIFHSLMMRLYAETEDAIEVWDMVLDEGIDINMQDDNGQTALHALCSTDWQPRPKRVEYMLSRGAATALSIYDSNGYQPLHCAAQRTPTIAMPIGDIEALRLLLEAGADVNVNTQDGLSPLSLLLHIPAGNGSNTFGNLYGTNRFQVVIDGARLFCSYGAVWDEQCERRLQYTQELVSMPVEEIRQRSSTDTVAEQVEGLVIAWREHDPDERGHQNPLHVLSGLRACIKHWTREHQHGVSHDELAIIARETVLEGEVAVNAYLDGFNR